MYRILTEDQVIYDSANKDDYPVTSPALDLELNQAGSLEFTMLPGHLLYDAMHEMQTLVTMYQDNKCLFYGRVLTIDKDLHGAIQVYCEGALTFLLDSELEPITVTETVADFLRRCIESHNSQVEPDKQFEVGEVTHEKAAVKMEFKIDSYIDTQNALTSSLTGKHGGFLRVRLENGKRYLDYLQENTHVNSQSIRIGENIIDKNDHASRENVFSILRPIGKNKLTIEKASSRNLFSTASLVTGKKLTADEMEIAEDAADWCYFPEYMPVTPGTAYVFAPIQCRISFYDSSRRCIGVFDPGDGNPEFTAEASGSNLVTAPENAAFARMSCPLIYKDCAVFKIPGQNLINSFVRDELLGNLFLKEIVTESDRWCHTEMVTVTPGATYLATPGSIYLNYYKPIAGSEDMKVPGGFVPVNDLGGDFITIPDDVSYIKISFPSRYAATQRFELAAGNLTSRTGQVAGKRLTYETGEKIEDDSAWSYTSSYITVQEDAPYTGSPAPFRMTFYDEKKKLLTCEEAGSGEMLDWVTAPSGAKFARVSVPLASQNDFLLQQGKSLIRTHLDAGNKVIELPDRIAKCGRIIHTENFPDIDDAQSLYNAAIDFLNRRAAELPKTCEVGVIDLHLLNPAIERVDLGDVFPSIEGFDEPMVAAAQHKDLEDPQNDTVTFKNASELAINDAGSSSGSISSAYASSSRSDGFKYKSIREELDEADSSISKLFLIASRNIELHALEDLWLGTAGKLTLIAKGDDGAYGRITLDKGMIHESADNIVRNAHNVYNIADSIVTIADNVYTQAQLIWNEAKDIVTIADNVYTLADNMVTIADAIYTQANTMTFVAGNVDTVDTTIKKIFGSAIHQTAQQLALANGVISIDQDGVLHIAEGSGIKLNKNGTEYGIFSEDMLTAGVIVEKITGKTLGTKTAMRLLGDEIDLRGNTTIQGFLDVRGTVSAPEFILKSGVKIGSTGGDISLSSAIQTIKIDSNAGTLTYTTIGGTPTTVNFNSAAAALALVRISNGTWDSGSKTIRALDGNGNVLATVIEGIPTPTDYNVVKLTDTLYGMSFFVGGKPFNHNVDTTDSYNAGVASVTPASSVTVSNSDIVRDGEDDYSPATHNTIIYIEATASNGAQGTQSFTVSGTNAYNAGWIDGYNAAVAVSGKTADTVTIPTTTSAQGVTPTTSYTAKARVNDNHYISFPSAISLVPGQTFNGSAGNYVYKNSVELIGTVAGAVYWE